MNLRYLSLIILGLALLSMFSIIQAYSNKETKQEQKISLDIPEETLESCQKQRAILFEAVKDLDGGKI